MDFDKDKRKAAVRALINIAILEGGLIFAVIGVYLYTDNINYLILGLIGVLLIFGPVYFRFVKSHGGALRRSSSDKNDIDL
ncbi:MAG: hypothetical protein AAGJ73_07195 [Pseudomonadota bacterium]